jgi:hypothetical protein
MSKLDARHDAFQQRLEKSRQQHQEQTRADLSYLLQIAPAHLPPQPDLSKLEDYQERAAAYDAWLEKRIALYRGYEVEPAPPPQDKSAGQNAPAAPPPLPPQAAQKPAVSVAPPLPAAREVSRDAVDDWLVRLDQAVLQDFSLQRFSLPGGLAARPHRCPSQADFLAHLGDGLRLSRREQQELSERPPAALSQIKAFHLPGQGSLVNLPAAAPHAAAGQSPPPPGMIDLLHQVTCARWGDGFLVEYTRLGEELVQGGLWPAYAGRRLGLRLGRWEASAAALQVLERSWGIAAAGWREWIWEYLACKSRQPIAEGVVISRPNVKKVWEIFSKVAKLFPIFIDVGGVWVRLLSILDVLKFLFLQQTGVAPRLMNSVLREVEKFSQQNDEQMSQASGSRSQNLLGWLYLSRLEANLGTFCVPYALLIAFHSGCGPGQASPEELEKRLAADPLLNANTRLAMLAGLDSSAKYDPHGMSIAAWEELKLDSPQQYMLKT